MVKNIALTFLTAIFRSAPEVLKSRPATIKSDVFSFGIVIHEILTYGATPYENIQSNHEVIDFVVRGGRMEKVAGCSDELYAIMKNCWNENADARPNFMELLSSLKENTQQTVVVEEELKLEGTEEEYKMLDKTELDYNREMYKLEYQ